MVCHFRGGINIRRKNIHSFAGVRPGSPYGAILGALMRLPSHTGENTDKI
jgi:hypothetical protein